ncbi:MAG: hypothetical protein JWM33_2033 [Caulobacteraceae bacterium]|nr:hypothetical protein [Caulobacteraceae bacterium]
MVWYDDIWNMEDNLPNSAPAKPKKARRVLVLAHASGYVHSVIPLTALTVSELGKKTGAWSTDIIYDLKDFTAANLARYDVLVLDNTTGSFLDEPVVQANAARGTLGDPPDVAARKTADTAARRAALLDYVRSGHGLVLTHAAGDSYHGGGGTPSWPEFNHMVGGSFKFHWTYPQVVTVKIDDPKSPINAAFGGQEFVVHDEVYTFRQDENNDRSNFHVLTSIDYARMSPEDKAKEGNKRTDGDYVLSWIRREGQGRVFYQVLGHSEHVLYMQSMLKQFTAGIQYAAGDLAANDTPSAKPKPKPAAK